MTEPATATFDDLLQRFRAAAPVGTDDVIGATRTLLEEVRDLHEAGRVAALDRVDLIALGASGELRLGSTPTSEPTLDAEALRRIEAPPSLAIDIVRQIGVSEAGGEVAAWDRSIAAPGQVPDRPLFYPNYGSWERAAGVHDALTDIFHLGLIIASLATALDLRERHDLARLVQHRSNLLRLNPRLHPALARIVADMTEPVRARRAADLSALIDLLDDYRSVEVDDAAAKAGDLADVADPAVRRQRTQEYFRNRLFEVTRRNKLLYFADRHGVDLTRGSFPLMLDYRTLRARQLLTASPDLMRELARLEDGGEARGELDLRRWLQCGDYPFLAPGLDKVRAAARKDLRELGFNQLRLVLAFLRWHDDEKGERINSPLAMLPVTLKKQPGTADGFSLAIEGPLAEAEVNPVLRYLLAERFRIQLPETLDLTRPETLPALRERLEGEVRRLRPGVAIALLDRPRVQLIQRTIKRQLDEHQRRQRRAGQSLKDWRGVSYSYAAENYQPLGYELFDRFVRPRAAPGRELALGGAPAITGGLPDRATERTITAETYAFESPDQGDPLNWEIDLCAVTLANFNTRKMSLVRDYEVLLDGYVGDHANYGRLFEHGARPALAPIEKPAHSARSFVLPSDPSQDEAILRAATGESYVIQGPPGTGKSQTIANLLADLAARGKSVLFVCEKRVALDVVHNRLRDAGIGDLACLVHDAREDRLAFIADLKKLYEDWLAGRTSRTALARRNRLAEEIDAGIQRLADFSDAMQRPVGAADTVRSLMGRAIADGIRAPRLGGRERERVPAWEAFAAGEPALAALEALVQGSGGDRAAVAGLMRMLRTDLARASRPIGFLDTALPAARQALAEIASLAAVAVPPEAEQAVTLRTLAVQAALAARLRALAEAGKLNLIDRLDPEASRLQKQLDTLARLETALAAAAKPNAGWTRKPSLSETEAGLALARRKEGRFWSFLSGDWRALQRLVAGQLGAAPASIVQALESLAAEHAARCACDEHEGRIRETFGLDDLAEVRPALAALWAGEAGVTPAEKALVEAALRTPGTAARSIVQLAVDQPRLARSRAALDALLQGYDGATPQDLAQHLATLEAIREQAPELARRLHGLETASAPLAEAWRELPLDLAELRAAALHVGIDRGLEVAPEARAASGAGLQRTAEELGVRLAELRQLNARRTLEDQKARFRQHSAAKARDYDAGRAFLEHQFSLQRPSAAMRDFLAGDPARVVRDLKPIWMMSPLSVADTLPLREGLFDVVVFDEASQIPIEDAVPTLYRAPQAIVVGDEMQLPPPSYFARRLEGDETELPDYVAFGMQAESLLDKAVLALPSTRLDWHYRSRHEGLIGFCNQAFYAGGLKTIPSRQSLVPGEPIDTATPVPMKAQAARVLSRPISYHRISGGVFASQQNLKEAAYIAELVRALLSQDGDKSIGIVAFSQPQQTAIEEALERLARDNQTFRSRLDRAYAEEQEELFVKNLENVQGDERDIMIVSVAYAPGASGRMIMNFGPINQEGGEKRLNVIFSRAKHHMVVVASIDPAQITNDWNKGANALKRYMMYAAAASAGDTAGMRVALAGFPGAEHVDRAGELPDPLADRIAEAHRAAGREAVRGHGQSTARCDVAVRAPGASAFTTAILTDNDAHYEVADVVDRYVTYPGLLRAAGWQVELALAKDWLEVADDREPGVAPASDSTALLPSEGGR